MTARARNLLAVDRPVFLIRVNIRLNAASCPRRLVEPIGVAFNSATSSLKIVSTLLVGRPSPVTATRNSDASRLLVLMGKLSGSCPLWFRTW